MSDQLTLFAEGSLAKISLPPARVRGSMANDLAYGVSSPALLARYDPDTRSWRTSQLSLEGGLTEFSETFPRSGTMRNGTAYRLPPLVRLTGGTGFGSWPTPRNCSAMAANITPDALEKLGDRFPNLETEVARRTYPTPHGFSKDGRSNGPSGNELGRAVNRLENWPETVSELRTAMGLPTPTANRRSGPQSHGVNVVSGSLNPTWVEWLMGFPLGWTDLEASETP